MNAISLYARAAAGFDSRVAHALAVLESAATTHGGGIVQATSLGAEDMVLTDLIAASCRSPSPRSTPACCMRTRRH
jgi:phosphoadenosine phosphosulfate reductase